MHECESMMSSVKIDSVVTSAVKGWSLLLSIAPNHAISSLLARLVVVLYDTCIIIYVHAHLGRKGHSFPLYWVYSSG